MGKWAQYKKRGSSHGQGFLAAPDPAGFGIGTATSTTIPVTRSVGYPSGVSSYGATAQLLAGGAYTGSVPNGFSSPQTITGLNPSTDYNIRVAWFASGNVRLSPWSAPFPASTIA